MSDKTLGAYKRTTPDPDETTGEALARLAAEMTRLLDEADAELRDEADGGVAAALIEQEAEKRDPSVDYHAMWWKAEREREKAERERDEARATKDMHKRRADEERARADAAESRPLTPDAITDDGRAGVDRVAGVDLPARSDRGPCPRSHRRCADRAPGTPRRSRGGRGAGGRMEAARRAALHAPRLPGRARRPRRHRGRCTMSADNFTEAARAEAERRWSRDQADGRPLPGHARMSRRIGFEIGALWARTHLGAQEPTDAEVGAAAQALADRPGITYGVHPDLMRVVARAALSAARAARRDEEAR